MRDFGGPSWHVWPTIGEMATRKAPRDPGVEPVEEIRRQVAALTNASNERHRLERGTPEYEAALETEERLADRVWRLGAALRYRTGLPSPRAGGELDV